MNQRREEIINKAFFQFLNRGYEACSLKYLEEVTGLTRGAFYYYFRNKEEILREGLERYAIVDNELSEEEFGRIETLKRYIEIMLERKITRAGQLKELFHFFIIEEFYFQLVLETESIFPLYRKKINEMSKLHFTRWEQMILKAKQTGEIMSSVDTSVLARNLMSVYGSMVNIELLDTDLKYAFSDMRMQFEQYYLLIRRE